MAFRLYRLTDKKIKHLIFLTLVLLSCAIPIGPSIGGPQPVQPPIVPASALLLNADPFPSGWSVEPCDIDCDLEGEKDASRFFVNGNPGHVLQEVVYYGSVQSAQTVFETRSSSDLSKATPVAREPFVPFQPPDEITYRSPIADEQYLGCGIDVIPTCIAGRRYGQYFIRLFIMIDNGNGQRLKIDEIEPILRALDIQVERLLKLPVENLE